MFSLCLFVCEHFTPHSVEVWDVGQENPFITFWCRAVKGLDAGIFMPVLHDEIFVNNVNFLGNDIYFRS